MASIFKHGDKYRAQVTINGARKSRLFRTKREASAWAEATSHSMRSKKNTPEHTLADCVMRYAEEETPKKRGAAKEAIRLSAFLKERGFPAEVKMADLNVVVMSKWRDTRLQTVSAGTVLREISLLSAMLETARLDWGWIETNPLRDMRKPRSPDHREIVIQAKDVRLLLKTMSYSPCKPIRSVAQSVAVCFLVALRTGMRAGELSGLNWDRVHSDYCSLPVTKTAPRKVPLTRKAVRLLEKMKGYDSTSVFGLKSQTLDANFRKYRDRAGLSGFTFHDARHTAATMLARKLDVLDLCRMFGWTTTKHALIYYNPTASSIADILNRPSK